MVKKGEEQVAEEKVAELEEQTQELKEQVAESETTPQPAQDSEQLRQQLESLQTQLEQAKNEAKAHQRNVSKKDEEVQRLQARETRIDAIESQIKIVAGMVADIMDRNSPEDLEDIPKKRRSETYLSKLEEATKTSREQAEQASKARSQQIINETLAQLKSAGLGAEAMDSDEFIKAKVKFLEGKPEEGLEEVKKIVMSKTAATKEKPMESQEELIKRIREEERKKILTERGELEAETGQPKGGVRSFEDIEAAFGRGEIGFAEYQAGRSKKGI